MKFQILLFILGFLPFLGMSSERDSTLLLSIDGVVNETLNVLTGPKGEDRDWEWFQTLFTDDARIVVTIDQANKPRSQASLDLDRFIKQAGPVYKMRGFQEYELKKTVLEYNGIATVFQSFAAIQGQDTSYGINTYHLIRFGDEWKINQILFANNANGVELDAEWMPNADYQSEIKAYRDTLNAFYGNPEESPLGKKGTENFDGLPYFPVRESYAVQARLELTPNTEWFEMPTTTDRKPVYRQYAIAHFELDGMKFQLPVYQSKRLMAKPGYEDYLFVPFTDHTNGFTTYGGGRYLDVRMDENPEILVLDFNKAYNPYCAYSERYSCPLVPIENKINYPILAGVKYADHH